ncbi:MAG: putative racemase YgeA [Promethearchaeota archaeon]|nr:MAG: putative racemase YgeA [Candidatus Lokiarchaeota archaeon]
MKLIGLIGGMSWESTIEYYKVINSLVNERLGDWNSAKILLYSVNFQEILPLQNSNEWDKIAEEIIDICQNLEIFGCKTIVICSNTMHKIADQIESNISIPIIHVVDETAKAIKEKNLERIGLLGTKFTMEGEFYENRLTDKHGLTVYIPEGRDREYINNAIYTELAKGKFLDSTKEYFLKIIRKLKEKGSQGIILGCTEIPLIIKPEDVDIPLFDTLKIHLEGAVDFAFK